MAAFWLVLAVALCVVYFAVDGKAVDSDPNSGLASQKPPVSDTVTEDPSSTSTDSSTTDGTNLSPIFVLPGQTNGTDNSTDTTGSPTVNNTTTPSTDNTTGTDVPINGTMPPTNGTMTPANGTKPPANGTMPPANGTMPPANGTMPPTNGTKPPTDGTPPPTDGTQPPTDGTPPPTTGPTPPPPGSTPPTPGSPPPNPPSNSVPVVPLPPTGWIYPGILWPPMQPQISSSSSFGNSDEQMSDQSGDVLIEDFQETITIHKKTIRKHVDKFERENSDASQNSDVDYSY